MLQDEKKTFEVIYHLSELPVYFRFSNSLASPLPPNLRQGQCSGTKNDVNHSKSESDIEDRSGSLVQGYAAGLLALIDAMRSISDAVCLCKIKN